MIQKMTDKHYECARLLQDLKKEDSAEMRSLLYEMYTNALISLIRGPIEAILDASQPNAIPYSETFEAISMAENVLCGGSVPQHPLYDVFKYIGDMTKPKNMPY